MQKGLSLERGLSLTKTVSGCPVSKATLSLPGEEVPQSGLWGYRAGKGAQLNPGYSEHSQHSPNYDFKSCKLFYIHSCQLNFQEHSLKIIFLRRELLTLIP